MYRFPKITQNQHTQLHREQCSICSSKWRYLSSLFLVHVGNIIQGIILINYDAVIMGVSDYLQDLWTLSWWPICFLHLLSKSSMNMNRFFKAHFCTFGCTLTCEELCGLACDPHAQHFSLLLYRWPPQPALSAAALESLEADMFWNGGDSLAVLGKTSPL